MNALRSRWTLLIVVLMLVAGCGAREEGAASGSGRAASLALRVRLELLQKLGVDGMRVHVAAKRGQVHLSGEVKKRSTAELAERIAKQVDGVSSVRNEIRVAGGEAPAGQIDAALATAQHELDDAALATRVRLALVDHFGSDGFRVGTSASDGVVTLAFPSTIERGRRRDMERWIERLDGVSRVIALDKE